MYLVVDLVVMSKERSEVVGCL